MIELIKGGDYVKDGYAYSVSIYFPEFINALTINMMRNPHRLTSVSFPTYFILTRNNIYCSIIIRLFGLGLGLEIQSKT